MIDRDNCQRCRLKYFLSQVLGVALLISLGSLVSGQTLDIYKATALVKNQSEAERNRAARETLGEVAVRVSGQLAALDHPEVRGAIGRAQNYLIGFSYNSTQATLTEGDQVFPAMELQLSYSPQAIEQLLRKAQLPLWPAQRPSVLVWPVVRDTQGLRLELSPEVLEPLRQRAQYRGVPLVFPKGDTQDYVVLSVSDAWRFNLEQIHSASMRYKADAILVARLTPSSIGTIPAASYEQPKEPLGAFRMPNAQSPQASDKPSSVEGAPLAEGPWLGDWQLLRGDSHRGYASETPELGGLLMQIADDMADEFARQYAFTTNNLGPQTFYLQLGRIGDFGSFKKSQAYLGGLAMVKKMEVVKVDAAGLLVGLTIEGDLKLLVTTLALGKKLQPVDPAAVARILNQPVATAAISEAEEAALAAALDVEMQQGSVVSGTSSVSTFSGNTGIAQASASSPLKYLWAE